MAIITVELDPNKPLTEEQIKELEALKDRPIIFENVAEARILLKEYRGFSAMAEYELESKVFFGRLDGIRDLVTFEAESESELFTQFQEAVDDYIDFCATLQEGTKRVLSLKEISEKATPLAKQYGVKKLYLFGSYARGEAKPTSDVDFYIEKGRVEGLQLVSLQMAFEKALGKPVDLLTTGGMDDAFLEEVQPDEILLYTEDK